MSEIFASIKLKEKISIIAPMAALAVILATLIGVLSFCTMDRHTHVYDYTLEADENGFNLIGVCTVDNCERPFYRRNGVEGVKLVSAISPSCSSAGERVYTLTEGGVTIKYVETIPALPHTYNFEEIKTGDTSMIIGMCTVDGCTNARLRIENVTNFKLVSETEGSCFIPGIETYSYVIGDKVESFETISLKKPSHTLAGQKADSIANEDGSFAFGIEGLKVDAGQEYACGTVVDGYYVCDLCKQIIEADVRYPEHEFVYNEENTKRPTVNTSGLATLHCDNEGCREVVEVTIPKIVIGSNTVSISGPTELYREIVMYIFESEEYGFLFTFDFEIGEKLTHDYKYSLVPNEVGFDLVGVCNQPDCQTPKTVDPDVEVTFTDTSTCQKEGIITWTHIKDGVPIIFRAESPVKAPHAFEYDGNKGIPPSVYREGLIELYCTTEGCTHTVNITLPAVVVGEGGNTVIIDEKDGDKIGLYTYVSEENHCTVELKVTIYQEK